MAADPRQNKRDVGDAAPPTTPTTTTYKKNLLQQLPAGAVLAFQTLSASFTNQGNCLRSNWWLTVGLVVFLSVTCILFSFTDSLEYNGKVYYGVATPRRLNIFNLSKKEEREELRDLRHELRKRGLKPVDWVHGLLSLVVFLTIAGSDVGLQNCFFPAATEDTKQLLRNLPLGMAVMSSFLFTIFPTKRKGVSFDSKKHEEPAADAAAAAAAQEKKKKKEGDDDDDDDPAENKGVAQKATDKVLTSSANLLQLLPTGTVMAFQTLSASFTNQGNCHPSNLWLTAGLVTFLTVTCIFSSFTDSVQDLEGKVHKGVALPSRLHIIGMPVREQRRLFDPASLRDRRLKVMDWVHAFFTAVVFLTIAGSDIGLQNCFFPKANDDTKQLLKNLPLGMAVMSSFVFIIFPTSRKGMGFDDSDHTDTTDSRPERRTMSMSPSKRKGASTVSPITDQDPEDPPQPETTPSLPHALS